MIAQRKRSRIRGPAQPAHVLHVIRRPLVRLHVQAARVQRRERPIAFAARKRLQVAVLVAGQLHGRLEGLRAHRTLVRPRIGVNEQMVIVHRLGLEAAEGRKREKKK